MNVRTTGKGERRQQILEVLARELERHPGTRITTAGVASSLGVSEAALYRHFASKAKMFEALIGFAEDSVFGLVSRILSEETSPVGRCEKILHLLLRFGERNPGITRLLVGDALLGENERLRLRVAQFFERLETQIKQVLREAVLAEGPRARGSPAATANLFLAHVQGQLLAFVRTEFRERPTEHWEEQWPLLAAGSFNPGVAAL